MSASAAGPRDAARPTRIAPAPNAALVSEAAVPAPSETPRTMLSALVHRLLHPRPLVLETRRPVEVPVLTETKRRWGRGERATAIRFAYEASLLDVQRAFGLEFPPSWTHQDILERGVTPEMGSVPEFLLRLLALYEPVRYGEEVSLGAESPVSLLESIYAHPKMWGLYVVAVPAPETPNVVVPRKAAR
jgi:hypothetical protein